MKRWIEKLLRLLAQEEEPDYPVPPGRRMEDPYPGKDRFPPRLRKKKRKGRD